MLQAFTEVDEKWQKEIDRTQALQVSQNAWRAYRDKEFEALGAFNDAMQGTMWGSVAVSKRMELNRERALLLRDYIDTLSER